MRKNHSLGGIYYGGDFLQRSGMFCRADDNSGRQLEHNHDRAVFEPREHDPSRQMWRDLLSLPPIVKIMREKTGRPNRNPGIVNWLAILQNEEHIG